MAWIFRWCWITLEVMVYCVSGRCDTTPGAAALLHVSRQSSAWRLPLTHNLHVLFAYLLFAGFINLIGLTWTVFLVVEWSHGGCCTVEIRRCQISTETIRLCWNKSGEKKNMPEDDREDGRKMKLVVQCVLVSSLISFLVVFWYCQPAYYSLCPF